MSAKADRAARNAPSTHLGQIAAGSPGVSTFLIVWFGQVVSLLGSGLTGFALGVWVYQQTGSATELSVILVCTRFPGVVISPIAGALVDRWDRRVAMLYSDFV